MTVRLAVATCPRHVISTWQINTSREVYGWGGGDQFRRERLEGVGENGGWMYNKSAFLYKHLCVRVWVCGVRVCVCWWAVEITKCVEINVRHRKAFDILQIHIPYPVIPVVNDSCVRMLSCMYTSTYIKWFVLNNLCIYINCILIMLLRIL